MRSALGSGAVLGVSTGVTGGPAADVEARGAVDGKGVPLAALGSPLPSAKCAGKTSVGAPGSVE